MLDKHIKIINNINSFFSVDNTYPQPQHKEKCPSLKASNECCICLEDITQRLVIYPCGHSAFCNECISKIRECSICKGDIKDIFKVYL